MSSFQGMYVCMVGKLNSSCLALTSLKDHGMPFLHLDSLQFGFSLNLGLYSLSKTLEKETNNNN